MGTVDRLRICIARLGGIFFAIAISCLILSFAALLSVFALPAYILILLLIVICTFGLIFVIDPNFSGYFSGGTESFASFAETLTGVMPYFAVSAVIFAFVSAILLIVDPRLKKKKSVIYADIVIVFLAAAILLAGRIVQ